jgi:trigger factor
MLEDLKFHLMKDKIAKENEIKVEPADVDAYARKIAKSQFAQYGMLSVPDDILDNYSKDMMKNQETIKNIYEKVVEEKVFEAIKNNITLDEKAISIEDFNKMFEEK